MDRAPFIIQIEKCFGVKGGLCRNHIIDFKLTKNSITWYHYDIGNNQFMEGNRWKKVFTKESRVLSWMIKTT